MIRQGTKDTIAIHHGRQVVLTVYLGTQLLWSLISSCFGAGYWQSAKRWSRQDAWKRS